MNILMVGHSGAGKTSFMAGMYKCVGESIDGYGISAKKENQKNHLKKIADNLVKGHYPAGTDIQNKYEFVFTVDGSELIPFNWIDYRGGILLSEDPDDYDMEKFMTAIKQADALVVFLDGEKLSQAGSRWNMEYDILISCIESSLSVTHDSLFPISFVITKCDLVADGAAFSGLERFTTLFTQIEKSNNVGGMLLKCSITPTNYGLPFLVLAHSIYGGAPIYIQRCNKAMQAANRRANNHRPTSILGKVFGVGEQILKEVADIADLGWETEYEKTWAAEKDYEYHRQNLLELQEYTEDLKEKLISWAKDEYIVLL